MKKGFSLLEVLLALALFSLMVYSLYPMYYTLSKEMQEGRREDELVEIAKNIYEKRRAGLEPGRDYRVEGRAYRLEERVLEEREDRTRFQWTLKGDADEKTWTAYIPKEGIYTP